eukprot:8039626-Alexandrium_andersonii.AAC.1
MPGPPKRRPSGSPPDPLKDLRDDRKLGARKGGAPAERDSGDPGARGRGRPASRGPRGGQPGGAARAP